MTSAGVLVHLDRRLHLLGRRSRRGCGRPMRVSECQSTLALVRRLVSCVIEEQTVLRLNTPMTLSHSVPLLGCQPNSLDIPLASFSTRSRTSSAEYSAPLSPHVKGGLAWCSGCRPYSSFNMNSLMGIESGGSKGSFGTHDGAVKTIATTE